MKANKLDSYSITALTLILGILAPTPVNSQPITPANDGTGTTVTPQGNQFNIEGGTRNGANLFHSFDQFNVNSGQTANFLTTPDTSNILGRVTGGNASYINGLLQVIGGNSNLFLMNPAGIMFGQNASLNIPASFSVTTATGIGFDSNNFWFKAMGTNDYANLVGDPSGYRFNVSNPGAIVNEGNLTLNPGENLTLLGGTLINTGELSTAGGNITIAAVEGGSVLRISQPGHLLSLEVDPVIVNGEEIDIAPLSLPGLLTGGEIIQATSVIVNENSDVVLTDSNTVVADIPGTAIASGDIDVSSAEDVGGQVNVLGDRVALVDTNINADGLNGGGTVLIGGDSQESSKVFNSQETSVNSGSIISANAIENGDGGRVIVWSDGTTNFAGDISAKGGGFSGNGGFVEVTGKEEFTFDGTVDVTAALGEDGTILLQPESVTIGESENSDSSPIVEDNTEVETIENSEIADSSETTETEVVENNTEVETTENSEIFDGSETTETEVVENNTEVETTENSEIADSSETTETELATDPFAQDENADLTISAENIGQLSGNVILEADNDITVNEKIETDSSVELKAGRSININADIDTSVGNGNIDLLGNNDEMNLANRSDGKASINQLDGTTLNAGSGTINIQLGNLGEVGDINLSNLTTTGQVLVNANGGNIARVSDSSIINAGSALFQTSGIGGIGLTDTPLQLNVGNLEAVSGSGGVFFDVGNVNIGGVSEDFNGISAVGGELDIKSEGNVTLAENISADGAINIEATGDIVATRSGIKGAGESVSLSATNIRINDEFDETSGDADVKLEATNNITVEDIEDDVLEFLPGDGEIEFRADLDGDGVGVVEMLDNEADVGSDPNTFENGADTIKTNGRNLSIAGAGIVLGNIDTSGLPVFSGGELLAAIDVDEGGAIPPEVEDKSGFVLRDSVDFSDVEFDSEGNYIIGGESYYLANIEGEAYLVPTTTTLKDTATFTFTVDGDLETIENLDIRFSAQHTSNIELEVNLESPQRQQVTLFSGVGGFIGQNFQDTVLDDDASSSIDSAFPPFDGTYRPQESLAEFNGENPNGTWTLRVTDTPPIFNSGTLYRAGETAPWGTAKGTQLLLRNSTTLVSAGGNGGAINLEATHGDINVGNLRSLSETADGGRIDLKANNSIITGLINSSSTQGIGGDINLNAISGNIDTFSLDTSSLNGDGGNIEIKAVEDITTAEIITDSGEVVNFTINDGSGNAGQISIESKEGSINTAGSLFARSLSGDGGDVTLSTQTGDITTEALDSRSYDRGDGGDITISTQTGDITTEGLNFTDINSTEGNKGNITISTQTGDITTGWIYSSSYYYRNGGDITISTQAGDINTGWINSSSYRNGGDITISTQTGDITTGRLHSNSPFSSLIFSSYYYRNGGDITISTQTGDITNIGSLNSSSSYGNGGNITVSAQTGHITTQGIDSYSSSSYGNGGNITVSTQIGNIITEGIDSLDRGNGGNITVSTQTGDITTDRIESFLFSSDGNGGNITVSTQTGDITTGRLYSFSHFGNGGDITVSTQTGDITTGTLNSTSYSRNGGDITVSTQSGDIVIIEINSFSLARSEDGVSGNGGSISLSAETIKFNSPEYGDAQPLSIRTFSVGTKDSGNGGDINITANNLSNTEILTLSSHGKSGEVAIESQPQGNLQLNDLSIITSKQITIELPGILIQQIDVGATEGQSGNVSINSNGNLNLNKVTIESDTKSDQAAGNVTIESKGGVITFDNSNILSITNAEGDAGEIILKTPQDIQLTNNSKLQADTQGKGNAGNIEIEAGTLNLDQNTSITTETSAEGAPGNINIKANTIDIGVNAQISATVTAESTNTEGGGNIDISANTLNISGTLGIFAETAGLADAGTLTIQTYNDNPNLDINFSNDGFISARTTSTGTGGNINILAPENINIAGNGEIRVTTNNTGNGGIIKIETQNLTTSDGVSITASTTGDGNAGAIKVETKTFNLETGTSLTTETNSAGKAGDIKINSEIVTIGEGAEISATAREKATNQEAGSITINSNTLNISGELGIFAETQGDSPAGTLTLKPYNDNPDLDINFSNQGFISASTISSGNGGNINISAPENIDISGEGKISVETTGTGDAGNITVETQNLTLTEGVSISAETNSAGKAGNIEINSPTLTIGNNTSISATAREGATNTETGGNISIFSNILNISGELGVFAETQGDSPAGSLTLKTYSDNPDLDINFSNSGFISASTSSIGQGGDIDITALETIDIKGDGKISVETTGAGDAGNININTQNLTIADGIDITASTTAAGNAGNIDLEANNINIQNNSEILAFTEGEGTGGNITIEATETFNLDSKTQLSVETNSAGKAGNIEINSPQVTIGEGAKISATAREGATNTETAGNITINSNQLDISGELGVFAETQGEAPAGTLKLNPYRRVGEKGSRGVGEQIGEFDPDLNITFTEKGFISARTTSSGNGGNIKITAPENINIQGNGKITVETEGTGNAGEINIQTQNLTIAEGIDISAATSNNGAGGSININPTEKLELNGQIITETTSTGDGGKITINTGSLTTENGIISARSTETATGNAGSIEITAQSNITTGIITSSANNKTEAADGGKISITSEKGEINATQPIQSFSEQGNAGDVTLNAQTNVTTNIISSHGQQQGGQINITAETGNINTSNGILANYSGGGDGGNVNLIAPQGDITTSNIYSFADGDGGKISITAGGEINLTENSNIISASQPPEKETRRHGEGERGRGGDIILKAGNNINTTTARIYSGADIGDTGKIEITADSAIEIGQIDLASGFVREKLEFNDNNNFTLIPRPEGEATQGFAGDISIKSNNGTIDTTASTINSRSPDGSGKITIEAMGNITTGKLEASALNTTKPTTGGDINITSQQGEITATQAIETFSKAGRAGSVNIDGAGHVEVNTIQSEGTQRGGHITIRSNSENSINVLDDLNTFSTQGTAGNITLTSPGTITIRGIRSDGMQQGGEITVKSEIGSINATEGDIDSFSEQGIGGDVELNASESVNIANVSSYGMTESGDLTIQSQQAQVNTGNVTTEAPEGSSGSIRINGTEVGTGDLSSIGTTSAGEINVEAVDGSIKTYDIEIKSDGTIGSLTLQATEDVETRDISQEAGEGDANTDIESGGDQTAGDINQTAEEDTNVNQNAGGDLANNNITQNAGDDATVNQDTSVNNNNETANAIDTNTGNITNNNVTQNAGDDATVNQDTSVNTNNETANAIDTNTGNITNNNVTQNAGDDAINNQNTSVNVANTTNSTANSDTGNITNIDTNTGNISNNNITQNAGDDAINNQNTGVSATINNNNNIQTNTGDVVNNNTTNIQANTGNIITEDINQTAGNNAINNQNTGVNTTNNNRTVIQTNTGDVVNNNTTNIQANTGNIITEDINQTAGNNAINNQNTGVNNTNNNTINIRTNGGKITTNDNTNTSIIGGDITTGNINQNAGNESINIQIPGGNQNLGNFTQNAGNNTTNIQTAGGQQNIGNFTQNAGNNTTNIQTAGSQQNLGEINQNFGNESINIQSQEINQNTSQISININDTTPSNNNQTTNTGTAKEQTEESINHTTDSQQILKIIDTVNTNPLTVATGSDQVVMMLEESRIKEYSDYFGEDFDERLVNTKNVRDILTDMANQTGKESAIVYVNAYQEQLQIILVTKDGQPILKNIPTVNRKKLFQNAMRFTVEITDLRRRNTTSYLPFAQKLYQWLIAPIAAELEAANIDTILFSMDTGFRLFPLAALHDGEQFLIEKYNITTIPSVSLMDSRYHPIQNTKLLGMGASEFRDNTPLPAVPVELETISQKLWQGNSFLNQEFTIKNMISKRQNYPYPIIHLATHAKFKSGDISQSYVQFWEQKLRLNQVRKLGWNHPAVELLVLSACQTAVGNRQAELGFAGFAVATGVKSVLGSLWLVSDEGTLGLMTEFYAHLSNVKIKAEALREAQLRMLSGEVIIEEGKLRGSGSRGEVTLPPELVNIQNKSFSHPYYWAGFTMIGSPW